MSSLITVHVEGLGPVSVSSGSDFAAVVAASKITDTSAVLAVRVDNVSLDLTAPATDGAHVTFLRFEDEAGLEVFRHSSAHLMAHAVSILFPDAKPTIGPVVEEGFYYDFGSRPFVPEDLEKIESKMAELVTANVPLQRVEVSKAEALKLFADNLFKVEIINDLPEGTITVYRQGDFVDLCRGPHVPSTEYLKAFKLTKVAGAYWRGDQEREQLQRIYGISFPDQERLTDYLKRMEEARERDHRKIGQDMELFSFHEEGQGFPFWHANGMVLRNAVIEYWREAHRRHGYVEILTPSILDVNLWKRSGHYDHYRENMYFTTIDDVIHAVKPMNCPGGLLVYKNRMHSYREFPMRVAELGAVHRHEMSGVLHGLFRVRSFTQDDAHIFCTPAQVKDEVGGVIDLVREIYSTFGFHDVAIELSTRPEKSIGSDEMWENAEAGLRAALADRSIVFAVNPGDGAFYGPKIDFHIRDCMGRSWQCGTIQVDFSMPERFQATYEAEDGTRKCPVMLHRAILGSLERFIGILIEHYAGKFPLFLSPVQARVLPVSDKFNEYAQRVQQAMMNAGLRVEADLRPEKLGKKVRDAQMAHINYQLVIGGREETDGTVSVRTRSNENLGALLLGDLITRLKAEVDGRVLPTSTPAQ